MPSLFRNGFCCTTSQTRIPLEQQLCEYYGVIPVNDNNNINVNINNKYAERPRTVLPEDLPPTPKNCLRVVVVSDTHERHRRVGVPAGDLLLHCGDILMFDRLRPTSHSRQALADFMSWLNTHPHPVKIFIAGNHDQYLQQLGAEEVRRLAAPAIYLCDESATIQPAGLRVYGSPRSIANSKWSPNTAFQSNAVWGPVRWANTWEKKLCTRGVTLESSSSSSTINNNNNNVKRDVKMDNESLYVELEESVEGPIDILLTHQSVTREGKGEIEEGRMVELLLELSPRLHLCGHVHKNHGMRYVKQGANSWVPSLNAAIMRDHWGDMQCPCVLDFQLNTSTS